MKDLDSRPSWLSPRFSAPPGSVEGGRRDCFLKQRGPDTSGPRRCWFVFRVTDALLVISVSRGTAPRLREKPAALRPQERADGELVSGDVSVAWQVSEFHFVYCDISFSQSFSLSL